MLIILKKTLLYILIVIIKKYFVKIISSAFVFFILVTIAIPSVAFNAGNIFFGESKVLYNINLAHFFYKQAAYPIFFTQPPRYAHHELSRTYFIQGKLDKALEEAEKELEIYPDDTSTYYILGLTLAYMNRTHEAIDAFSKYIDTHPGTWAGRNDKAWLQFRIGDINSALVTLEPVAKTFTFTPWVQNTYCALLIAKKKYEEALEPCINAKNAVEKMTVKDWGHAYPGNDPRIYNDGLEATKTSVNQNVELINKNRKK